MIALPIPARYQSAPTMQAHMKIPSTRIAPRSSLRTPGPVLAPLSPRWAKPASEAAKLVTRCALVVIPRALVRKDRLSANATCRHDEPRESGGEARADDLAREANAAGGVHLHTHAYLTHRLITHRRERDRPRLLRSVRLVGTRVEHVHRLNEPVQNHRCHRDENGTADGSSALPAFDHGVRVFVAVSGPLVADHDGRCAGAV